MPRAGEFSFHSYFARPPALVERDGGQAFDPVVCDRRLFLKLDALRAAGFADTGLDADRHVAAVGGVTEINWIERPAAREITAAEPMVPVHGAALTLKIFLSGRTPTRICGAVKRNVAAPGGGPFRPRRGP